MGAKKLPHPTPAPKAVDNTIQKAEIERMKKLLSEKIKNPELARKAAMIITEMLNSKS